MNINQAAHQFSLNPKRLFLVDGAGAVLSAFLLGVVLIQLEYLFGIPSTALYILAFMPGVFFLYDLYCYFYVRDNIAVFIKVIAYSNLLYCLLSIVLMSMHFSSITYLGFGYIFIEIVIIAFLVLVELKTASLLGKR